MEAQRKKSFYILLLSIFLNYGGVAMVYPLFSTLFFDPAYHFFSPEVSAPMRGFYLGLAIALHPIFQFLFTPFFGTYSDRKGRKKPLQTAIAIGLFGYVLALLAVSMQSFLLVVLFRICTGIGAGSCSILNAIVADMSSREEKAKNYGRLDMAIGAGYTLCPFLSGLLAHTVSILAPFIAILGIYFLNFLLVKWKLPETSPCTSSGVRIGFFQSLRRLYAAFSRRQLGLLFVALLIFTIGWSIYTEFIPLFLVDRFHFGPGEIGLYYGYTGVIYSLSAGFLIFPVIRRLGLSRALFLTLLLSGLYLMQFAWVNRVSLMWLYLPPSSFFFAFIFPAMAALVSNSTSDERQGEMMGVYNATISFGMAITPFLSGLFIGKYPVLTVLGGGAMMALSALPFALHRLRQHRPDGSPGEESSLNEER